MRPIAQFYQLCLRRLLPGLMLSTSLVLVACHTPPQQPDTAPTDATAAAEARLDRLFAAADEEYLRHNPVNATFRGDHRYNDQFANTIGAEYRQWQRQFAESHLAALDEIDPDMLSPQYRLSYEIFQLNQRNTLDGLEHPSHLMPVQQFYNPMNLMAMLGSGQSAQPFNTVADYDNWLSRVADFTAWIDQAILNMQEGMAAGITQPDALMVKVLPQLQAQIVDDPTQSVFYQPIANMPADFSTAERERLDQAYRDMISDTMVPQYQRLHGFIEDQYLPAARSSDGMGALPGGAEWYRYRVRTMTGTDLTPEEIHQIGLDEVARIQEEMREVMEAVDFQGDLAAFFEFTKTDPQFIFDSREAMLAAYEARRETVQAEVTDLFNIQPEAEFEIRAVESYREQSASSASYQRPPVDGSRPGIFYVNTYDLSARPRWTVESLYLHEAIPGHHFQLALQQEVEGLPAFRRFGGNTAYTEGWGLYAESLGRELGLYTDPYQYFGKLSAELWRAIRLVVDTGLHAKGWSREEVLDYMYANAPVAEARAVSETERFMAIPGQALAYKIGQLKIQSLRETAREALGEDFDIREFHTQVLQDGAVPLPILERKIQRWIAAGG